MCESEYIPKFCKDEYLKKKLFYAIKYSKNLGNRDEYFTFLDLLTSSGDNPLSQTYKLDYPIKIFNGTKELSIDDVTRSTLEKADVCIKTKTKVLYCSIKSFNGGKPTLINQLRRCSNIFSFKKEFPMFEEVANYIFKKLANTTKFQLTSKELNIPRSLSNTFKLFLEYFMKQGTGFRSSRKICTTLILTRMMQKKMDKYEDIKTGYIIVDFDRRLTELIIPNIVFLLRTLKGAQMENDWCINGRCVTIHAQFLPQMYDMLK